MRLTFEHEKIITEITDLAKHPSSTLMDAILHYSERNDIEIEVIANIVKSAPGIKSLLKDEAMKINMVEKETTLPL